MGRPGSRIGSPVSQRRKKKTEKERERGNSVVVCENLAIAVVVAREEGNAKLKGGNEVGF